MYNFLKIYVSMLEFIIINYQGTLLSLYKSRKIENLMSGKMNGKLEKLTNIFLLLSFAIFYCFLFIFLVD